MGTDVSAHVAVLSCSGPNDGTYRTAIEDLRYARVRRGKEEEEEEEETTKNKNGGIGKSSIRRKK